MTRKHHRRTRPVTPPVGAAPGKPGDTQCPHRAAVSDSLFGTRTGKPGDVTDTHRSAVIDLPTIVTVLYVDLMGPAQWRALGPARMATHITAIAADPRFRVPEMVALIAVARLRTLGHVAADRLAAADAFAPLVHAAAMANAPSVSSPPAGR